MLTADLNHFNYISICKPAETFLGIYIRNNRTEFLIFFLYLFIIGNIKLAETCKQ